jgi:hypothetical protein
MLRNAPRRFALVDTMILVAALSVGSLAVRATLPTLDSMQFNLSRAQSPGMRRFLALKIGLSAFIPYLAALTPAMLILRLRQPRPTLRHVGRQPGMVACTVATIAMAIETLWIGSLLWIGSGFIHAETIFVGYAQQVSFAVVGAWLALALSGRWRTENSWIDRLGCLFGWLWVGVTVLNWSGYYLI